MDVNMVACWSIGQLIRYRDRNHIVVHATMNDIRTLCGIMLGVYWDFSEADNINCKRCLRCQHPQTPAWEGQGGARAAGMAKETDG